MASISKILLIGVLLNTYSAAHAELSTDMRGFRKTIDALNLLNGESSQSLYCGTEGSDELYCPDLHSEAWCKEQFDLIKEEKRITTNPFDRGSGNSLMFLGEEHGDELTYSFYHKVLSENKFDCLFLELPHVFQKNFDMKKDFSYSDGTMERIDKKINEITNDEVKRISFENTSYVTLLKDLVNKARSAGTKIILVDSSSVAVQAAAPLNSTQERNRTMAKNILNSFQNGSCKNGLALNGGQHLLAKGPKIEPIDSLIKKEQAGAREGDKVNIKKAFIYSPTSDQLEQATGPCSWRTIVDRDRPIYFSGKSFYEKHNVIPSSQEKAMKDLLNSNIEVDNNFDYVIMLPQQFDKSYLIQKGNKQIDLKSFDLSGKRFSHYNQIPRKFITINQMESSFTYDNAKHSVSLMESAGEKMGYECRASCEKDKLSYRFVINDLIHDEKTAIKCPTAWVNHDVVNYPKHEFKVTVAGDCYCIKK